MLLRRFCSKSSIQDLLARSQVSTRHPQQQSDFNMDPITGLPQKPEVASTIFEESIKNRKEFDGAPAVFLFPGQGSQFVGMGSKIAMEPEVNDIFTQASNYLGYDLLKLCTDGPQSELNRTEFCQPAIYVVSLAAVHWLRLYKPKVVENNCVCAGISLGEISALAHAGCFSFLDGLKLVKARAKAMQQASELVPSGLISVFGSKNTSFGDLCTSALQAARIKLETSKYVDDKVPNVKDALDNLTCEISLTLFRNTKVIGGDEESLEQIKNLAKSYSVRRVKRLPVSGAFHTALMKPAVDDFSKILHKVEIKEPSIPVYCGVTGNLYPPFNPQAIRQGLIKQLTQRIKWETVVCRIFQRPSTVDYPESWEVGPGRDLGRILQVINNQAFHKYKNVFV